VREAVPHVTCYVHTVTHIVFIESVVEPAARGRPACARGAQCRAVSSEGVLPSRAARQQRCCYRARGAGGEAGILADWRHAGGR
jgi:hypothetical protein